MNPDEIVAYWARYPLRRANQVYRCKQCGRDIQSGERYVDGGEPWRRAHVLCASGDRSPMVWQLIATAPKDGRDILVWKAGYATVVSWEPISDGWCVVENIYVAKPTHWMPLPEPPQ